MTMELAQAMDHCSGPDYSIWFCRYVDRLACNMYRVRSWGGGGVNSLKQGTAYGYTQRFSAKVLSSQPLLLLAFF